MGKKRAMEMKNNIVMDHLLKLYKTMIIIVIMHVCILCHRIPDDFVRLC